MGHYVSHLFSFSPARFSLLAASLNNVTNLTKGHKENTSQMMVQLSFEHGDAEVLCLRSTLKVGRRESIQGFRWEYKFIKAGNIFTDLNFPEQ